MVTYEEIKIPELEPAQRKREYDLYNDEERDQIIYRYLFKGESHRDLDESVLGINPNYSRGWQAMGILHYLGLKNEFKGLFKDYKLEEAIKILQKEKDKKFIKIIKSLNRYKEYMNGNYIYHNKIIDDKELDKHFNEDIEESRKLNGNERRERLNHARKKPRKISVTSTNYERNPDVVVEVLKRANGVCEWCKNKAPFIRKSDNTPYLEVHHVIPLSQGGEDSVENAVALCPNCHREAHFGVTD